MTTPPDRNWMKETLQPTAFETKKTSHTGGSNHPYTECRKRQTHREMGTQNEGSWQTTRLPGCRRRYTVTSGVTARRTLCWAVTCSTSLLFPHAKTKRAVARGSTRPINTRETQSVLDHVLPPSRCRLHWFALRAWHGTSNRQPLSSFRDNASHPMTAYFRT